MSTIKRAVDAAYYAAAIPFERLVNKKAVGEREIWLVSERGFDARDNGYWFFRYLRKKHPEIYSYYVIRKDSADYERVSCLGPTIEPGSREHLKMIANASVLVSSHDCGWSPDMVVFHHLLKHNLLKLRGKIVFLQHGVSDKQIKWYFRSECKPDVFVVVTEDEKRNIIENHGQPESCVKLTGFPRYDHLKAEHEEENMLLIMPTWRQELQDTTQEKFEQSDYWKQYNALIHNRRLLDFAEKNGFSVVFYPHVEMQKYIKPEESGRLRIASMETDDVQDLLMKTKMLVTDYSSVSYDVLYMNKPVIYLQSDKDSVSGGHYSRYAVDCSKYGPVTGTVNETVDAIIRLWGKEKTGKDYNGLFKYDDRNNCERVYQAIRDCLKE